MRLMPILILIALLALPIVVAIEFNQPISDSDKAQFDQILQPVLKIYNFVKYAATTIAVLFLVFAGITFVISSNDPGKREQAKTMAGYIILGLVVIWLAPLIVQYVVT